MAPHIILASVILGEFVIIFFDRLCFLEVKNHARIQV